LYYPYESGYIDLKKHEALHGNGCENCHGPGSAHVAAENGDVDVSDDEIDKLRQEMVVTLAEARENMCMSCHDLDNSPDFVKEGGFDEYWPHIKHGGDE
jgi:formate-dependent nitrite reductase cytochrome c552 subunit